MANNKPYFPLDLTLDDPMRLIEVEFGITGFGVMVKLWQKIYATEGYYIEWSKDVELLFADEVRVSGNLVSEILKAAMRRGLFDADMYKKYSILTSHGIQVRGFNRLKRHKEVTVIKQYLLVDVTQILKDVNISFENVDNQEEIVDISKQIDKIDKIDEIEDSNDPAVAVFRKYEQLIGLITPSVQDGIDFFIEKGVDTELIIRLIEYACEQGKRTWSYIKASIKGNADAGIKTLDAYNRAQAQRAETAKRVKDAERKKGSKFNNYNDTNFKAEEYTADKFIAEMLGEV